MKRWGNLMKETTVKALNLAVDDMLKREQSSIEQCILSNITDDMTQEKIFAKMILNSLSVSVKLSTQSILSLLEESGVLRLDEREIEKHLLKHLSSKLEK